jgi:hypothetical protein
MDWGNTATDVPLEELQDVPEAFWELLPFALPFKSIGASLILFISRAIPFLVCRWRH